ncbi:hypothetical protein CLU92_5381 [Janthinobacterium sp. 61]|uniref:hypothetical protein n=1 Tax=Janthinobacterium sp. 61 TaxID=2035209 RepID=UPI000CB02384|nr:hypothetical protein [Janthinobacterium sp. 61]PKV47907.1 hypothetical protein CLU92_5381 [Janthinobacterium sp. 61]
MVDNYSEIYIDKLAEAFFQSRKLGFTRPPLIAVEAQIQDDVLRATSELLGRLSGILNMAVPGYWGNSCQTLSTNIFAMLNSRGIEANIILGNVIINTTDEFEVTLESLQAEVLSTESLEGAQNVHAWVSLGGDTIVDAALPPRLVKHYKAPQHFNDMILIGRAAEFNARYNIQYQPILVGTEFFARTNPPDPMDLLNAMQSMRT